jgi:hypothetical protein
MASAGGYEATYPFTVVAQASLDELEIPTSPPNTTVYAYAYLNAIPRAGGSVTLSSSDPSTAMVPASVPTNGNTYVPFNLTTGATSGTATVTATYNDASITEITYVTNASTSSFPDLCNFFINGDSTIEVGAAVLLYSEMCSASTTQSATGQIMFSTGGVVSTPTMTVEFPPATCDGCDIEISFPITGAANGTTNITMAANGQSDQVTITVKTPVFTMSGPTITIDEAETTNLGIDSDTLLATDRTFTLSSSAPSIVQVSSVSVTAGAGSTSTVFGIKGVAPGTSTITATNGSTVLTTTVTVE